MFGNQSMNPVLVIVINVMVQYLLGDRGSVN
jgi:hypothetical protein